ncbi:MAG TPA: DUF5979 domain-containing protein [Acidimicrobiales bacterium]
MAGIAKRRAGALLVVLGFITAIVGVFALPASAAPEDTECAGAFSGNPESSLALTSDPAGGSFVEAGDEIDVTATWDTADWVGTELDKLLGCVRINGTLIDSLTQEEKPVANSGTFEFDTITVPSDVEDGDQICMRARLSGQPAEGNESTQKSNVVCWSVGDAENPPPPAPTVALTVSKDVVNGAGGETFDFTVNCDPVSLSDENTDDDGVTFDDGVASFELGDGESVTFDGLPEDTACEVTETVPGGNTWTTTINGASDDDGSAVIELTDDDETAAFENTRVVAAPKDEEEEEASVLGNEQTRATPSTPATPAAPAVLAAAETPAAPAAAPAVLAATGLSLGLAVFAAAMIGLGLLLLGGVKLSVRPAGTRYYNS